MIVGCSAYAQQTLRIYYTVNTNHRFVPEDYITSDAFDEAIATAVINSVETEISSWDIIDSDTNDTQLLTNTEYCIKIRATVRLTGTCDYDPGVNYGPMDRCYPREIRDYDFTEGEIKDVDTYGALESAPQVVEDLWVEIDDPDIDDIDVDLDY